MSILENNYSCAFALAVCNPGQNLKPEIQKREDSELNLHSNLFFKSFSYENFEFFTGFLVIKILNQ